MSIVSNVRVYGTALLILIDFCAPDDINSTSEVSNDKQHEEPLKSTAGAHPEEPMQESSSTVVNSLEAEISSSETPPSGEILFDPLVLLCCENSLHLLSAKALMQVFYSIISLSQKFVFTL